MLWYVWFCNVGKDKIECLKNNVVMYFEDLSLILKDTHTPIIVIWNTDRNDISCDVVKWIKHKWF